MNIFIENHQRVLNALLVANVDFIVIGGYSVIFHGYTRTTGDIDIWLKPDNSNKLKFIAAMHDFGLNEQVIMQLKGIDFTTTVAFHIDNEPERIDFLTRINLVGFEEADDQKAIAEIDGLQIPFLHINHLILSKLNTGRAKDAADIEELQRLYKLNKK